MGKINIRPTTSVYATYKNLKYMPWTAIAEFVDNSTQSFFDNEMKLSQTKYWRGLEIEINYYDDPVLGMCLVIEDNAHGMNFEDFKRAIVLDSPPKRASRSEYGMGLKTSACWFGSMWKVESIELNSGIKYTAQIDVDYLHNYHPDEIDVDADEVDRKKHGTKITIWKLHKNLSGRQIGKTKDQLRGIYRCDLRSEKIRIYYNNEQLEFVDPEPLTETLPNGELKVWKKDIEIDIDHNGKQFKAFGFVGILEKASTSNAGFALLKNNRVVIGGYENHYRPEEVFEKSNGYVYQRMYGEIEMTNWPVTQTKDSFDWFDGLEEKFIAELKEKCSDYIVQAKKYRKNKKENIDFDIDQVVKPFEDNGVIKKVIDVSTIDNSNIVPPSSSNSGDTSTVAERLPDLNSEEEGSQVNQVFVAKKVKFQTQTSEYIFDLIPINDLSQQWLVIKSEAEAGHYTIEWNVGHMFFKSSILEQSHFDLLSQMIFALSLAEIELNQTSVNRLVEVSAFRLQLNQMFKSVMEQETYGK